MNEPVEHGYLPEPQRSEFFEEVNQHKDCCAKCLFWEESEPPTWSRVTENIYATDYIGCCRRYPPSVQGDDFEHGFRFQPLTTWTDWCGEYKQRPLEGSHAE